MPSAKFAIVSATGRSNEEQLNEMIKNLYLEDSIKNIPFTQNPQSYYKSASIFILPADIVFCNNSLLEAMERGIPPIVADIPGSELITEHNVSGLRARRDPRELAQAMLQLLENEHMRINLGRGARKKVETDFNEISRASLLENIYYNIWNNTKATI